MVVIMQSQPNIIKMETVEDDLLANKFPYPQYFDGDSWNTITFNSRRSIPTYLQGDLPNIKYQKIKAKFHQMNKFMPPQITYFEKMINKNNTARRRTAYSSRDESSLKKKRQQEVENLREQLQYALIMTNRNSKVLVDIAEKVSKAEKDMKRKSKLASNQPSFQQKLMKTSRSRSLQLGKPTKDCFNNTLDLVFSMKKKQCFSRLRNNPESDFKEEIKNRINSIRLQTFDQE